MKRNAKGYNPIVPRFCVGYDLSSRAVASQVLSALQSLTSVFGMGTGGPFALKTLTRRFSPPYSILILQALLLKSLQTNIELGSGNLPLVHLQGFEPGTH